MAVSAGTRLGPYEILSLLGAGGMGEVYKARDTKLGRDVAVKILPPLFADDPERLARFHREAELLASLNHPHIASIYGIEESNRAPVLVLEFVDGTTLADRIAQGAIPLQEALPVARQIAEALEAAHERGIVHRDLKPANIKLRPDGTVKVLDFGLAKALDPALAIDTRQSPTITSPAMTRMGMILGTAAYMSPEQAKGRATDKRSDIWAFGCVLFEMLTGLRAFDGESVTEVLAAVIHKEPPYAKLPPSTPAALLTLLQRCLQKDLRRRLQDIGDARIELEDVGRATDAHPDVRAGSKGRVLANAGWVAALVLGIVAATFAWLNWRGDTNRREAIGFQIASPPQATITGGPSISPDGRRLAFTARGPDGRVRIWLRSLDSVSAQPLPGTEDAFNPVFWSPDSRFVGFASGTSLKKIAITGGPPVMLCDRCGPGSIGSITFRGGSWSSRGVILFAVGFGGLWSIPDTGGPPARLFPAETCACSAYPTFLPDGRHFLYTWFGNAADPGVYVGSIDYAATPATRLIAGPFVLSSYAASSNDPSVGYLLILRERTLMAQPFDATRLQLSGEAITIADHVPAVHPPAAFSTSRTGIVAFSTSGLADTTQLLWFDRTGKPLGQLGAAASNVLVSFSPDGKRLNVTTNRADADAVVWQIFNVDVNRESFSRLGIGSAPVPSSDGRTAFTAGRDLWLIRSSGADRPEPLLESPNLKHANGWSPDGRYLIFDEHHPTRREDLWVLPMFGDRKPIPLVQTDADEAPGHFSPDGKWIAYSSDESGQREIYVRDFAPDRVPAVGPLKIAVSARGGDKPRWRADGTELYYIAPDSKLMAVPVKLTPTFEPGVAVPLFEINTPTFSFLPYDVAADGRFLVITVGDPTTSGSAPITVLVSWMQGLKKP